MSDSASVSVIMTAYLDGLSDKERTAMAIARDHLGTSFNLEKSIGFIQFKSKWKPMPVAPISVPVLVPDPEPEPAPITDTESTSPPEVEVATVTVKKTIKIKRKKQTNSVSE